MRRGSLAIVLLCLVPLSAAGQIAIAPNAASPNEDGQWVMPTKDFANTRFSGLREITKENVKNLKVEFAISTGTEMGQESAPIVVQNTLYFVTPYPNILFAVDLTKPGGAVKWRYEPKTDASAQGEACCEAV